MTLPIFPLYGINDFLIDKRKEIERLEKLYKKHQAKEESSDFLAEIREQREYTYNQGLSALNRYAKAVPKCIRDYYLGLRPEPKIDEILDQLQKLHYWHRPLDKKIIQVAVGVAILIATILAILL